MENQQTTTDFKLSSVQIYPVGWEGDPTSITQMVTDFSYCESITSPMVAATMSIVDSAGLLNGIGKSKVPLQGTETVEVKIEAHGLDDIILYRLKVWKLANRMLKNQKQTYTLGLVSEEALTNEVTRVEKKFSENPESIVKKMIKQFLTSSKTVYAEPSAWDVYLTPQRKRPFDVIADVCVKSVSSNTTYESDGESSDEKTVKSVRGSAGFFFWETRRGYNFFSVDSLCAEDGHPLKHERLSTEPHKAYEERLANTDNVEDDKYIILDASFSGEIDIMSALRKGRYSSLMAFFNHTTGQYEEYTYNINDSYSNMAHLGGQQSMTLLPVNQKSLTKKPSRIMSSIIDHEAFFNGPKPASPDEGDGSKDPTKFPDWQKFYAAQSLTRYQLLRNQIGTVVIPGNCAICAGDKIDLRFVNKVPSADIEKNPHDKETSGVYLVEEVTHTYECKKGANGRFITTVRLMRDSYGMPGEESGHDN